MKRWKLTLEYDGASFHGWQRQDHALSVQQVVEDAIHRFSGENLTLHVAGRTDAGVHAIAQIAHFDLEKESDARTICGALNFHVRPHPVIVLKAEEVSTDFHARFSATKRRYRYLILNREAPSALWRNRAWHIARPLDTKAMREAAQILPGKHDFTSFRAANCQGNSPIRTLDWITIQHDINDNNMIAIETEARSFLYHQVRNMVGSLAMVGKGNWSPKEFHRIFAAADRTQAGPTAPPDGLYFMQVSYHDT